MQWCLQYKIQTKDRKSNNQMQKVEGRQPCPISPPSSNMNNLIQLINFDPILSDYFKKSNATGRYWYIAYELMLDGLRFRKQDNAQMQQRVKCCCSQVKTNASNQLQNIKPILKQSQPTSMNSPSPSPSKPYNISYIKHNRFLSPSQKRQQITPKITQTIPVSSSPLVIYGKPRVKVDQQCGCPYHNNEEECMREASNGQCEPRQWDRIVHVKEKGQNTSNVYDSARSKTQRQPNILRYNSTPNLNTNKAQTTQPNQSTPFQKTKKHSPSPSPSPSPKQATVTQNFKKQKSKTKTIQAQPYQQKHKNSPYNQHQQNIIYVDRIVEVQSRNPGHMKIVKLKEQANYNDDMNRDANMRKNVRVVHEEYELVDDDDEGRSQQYLSRKYGDKDNIKSKSKQVQSKIKFLIQRDKRNKEMQKNLKKQQQKIKYLEHLIKNQKSTQYNDIQTKPQQFKKGKAQFNTTNHNRNVSESGDFSLSSSHTSEMSESSGMSMLDSQIVKKYRSQAGSISNKNRGEGNEGERVRVKGEKGQRGTKGKTRERGGKVRIKVDEEGVAKFGNSQLQDSSCFCQNSYNEQEQVAGYQMRDVSQINQDHSQISNQHEDDDDQMSEFSQM